MKSTRHARYENRIHYRNRITEEIETEMMMGMKNSASESGKSSVESLPGLPSSMWKTARAGRQSTGIGSLTKSQ